MSTQQVQLRRGTTAEHSGFTGAEGELTYDTDKKVPVIHDGSTQGGFPLAQDGLYVTGDGVLSIVKLTQAEYDALSFKDPTTLYVIAPQTFSLEIEVYTIFGFDLIYV